MTKVRALQRSLGEFFCDFLILCRFNAELNNIFSQDHDNELDFKTSKTRKQKKRRLSARVFLRDDE